MRLLPIINLCFLFLIALVLTGYFVVPQQNEEIREFSVPAKKRHDLPPNPFKLEARSYEAIGEGALVVNWVPPVLELPDLRDELVYYGKEGRPDKKQGKSLVHIAFKKSEDSKTVLPREKIYIRYKEGSYSFSPENQESALWLEVSPSSEYLHVTLSMQDQNRALVKTPEANHSFVLKEEEFRLPPRHDLEVGGIHVDGGFFMRQHARLVGKDLFFDRHGGEEFSHTLSRERIDFRPEERLYSCFVKEGDSLIWKEGQWNVVNENEDTVDQPLLVIKKIDDRMVSFDFWEAHGKGKMPLNLIRHKIHDPLPDIQQEFKFVGAKTWAQFILECRTKRMVLRSGDWLILEVDGWRKITTPEEVDDYVNQKLEGALFVLDKLMKQEGRQIVVGHIFNTARTEVQDIELKAFGKDAKEKEKPEEVIQ